MSVDSVVEAAEAILDAYRVEQAVVVVSTFVGRSVVELDASEADELWRAAGDAFFNMRRFRPQEDL